MVAVAIPLTHRLAICGWNEDSRPALGALMATRAFRPLTVLDRSGFALVSARRTSGLPCSQFVTQMLDAGGYEAALLAAPEGIEVDAQRAAHAGATLLIAGDAANGVALRVAVEAAERCDVPIFVLRPALHDPGLEVLRELIAGPSWEPRLLDVTIEAPTDMTRLAGIATAILARLVDASHPLTVTATPWEEPARAFLATVETAEWRAVIRTRHAPAAYVRIAGDTNAGAFDLRIEDRYGRLTITPNEGAAGTRLIPASDDPWLREGERIAAAMAAGNGDDLASARAEAALLGAIECAIPVATPGVTVTPRPSLTLMRGNGHASAKRTRMLRLV